MEAPPGPHCFDIAACGVALESMAHTLWNGISIDRTSVDAETSVTITILITPRLFDLIDTLFTCLPFL
jgi:hypothetical protein